MNKHIAQIKKMARPILKQHGVKRAALFGSVARGRVKSTSDIDVLVEFGAGKSLLDLVGLELALTERLGKKVDLVTYRSLHPILRDRILGEQHLIYGEGL